MFFLVSSKIFILFHENLKRRPIYFQDILSYQIHTKVSLNDLCVCVRACVWPNGLRSAFIDGFLAAERLLEMKRDFLPWSDHSSPTEYTVPSSHTVLEQSGQPQSCGLDHCQNITHINQWELKGVSEGRGRDYLSI